jgi:hypothetical protein
MSEEFEITETVLRKIKVKFAEKEKELRLANSANVTILPSVIDFYKTHSIDEVCEAIKKEVTAEFANMPDEEALKQATIRAFAENGTKNPKEEKVKEVMRRVTPSDAANIIGNYKRKACAEKIVAEQKSARSNYPLFIQVDDKDKYEFAGKYEEMCLAQEFYNARKETIVEVAEALKMKEPKCLSNMVPVMKKADRIVKLEDPNEREHAFINNVREKMGAVSDYLDENQNDLALSFGVGFVSGACVFLASINQNADGAPALAKAVATAAVMTAGLVTIFNTPEIKDYFKDQKSIKEAKALGLLDDLTRWGKTTKTFEEIKDRIEAKNKKGGPNGLS